MWIKIASAFILILFFIPLGAATSNFLETPEKSNYVSGNGNITYPMITHRTYENGFSRSILIGDINGDRKMEIIGLSAIDKGIYHYNSYADIFDNTLYVYSSNLSLLWKFRDIMADSQQQYASFKTSSLALGDLDGDGVDDIVFSISPSIAPIDTTLGEYYPKTRLYAFKGDGTQL